MNKKPHKKIREKTARKSNDKILKSILPSLFTSDPIYENKYFEYLEKNSQFFKIYKKWVLSQKPFGLIDDQYLYFIRNEIIGSSGKIDTFENKKINRPLFYLMLDILKELINNKIIDIFSYYEIKKNPENINLLINKSLLNSLIFCSKKDVEENGYPDFITALMDLFKIFFSQNLKKEDVAFSNNDKVFAEEFSKEWISLYPYSDYLYGFEVMPKFTTEDIFRYLKIPFRNKSLGYISKDKTYREVINYVTSIATFKPFCDNRIKKYFKDELVKLFNPLIVSKINNAVENGSFKSGNTELLKKEFEKIINDSIDKFDFFFASTKNLKKEKISSKNNLFFPVKNVLAKISHIFSNDQYPLTDYIYRKLIKKDKEFFCNDNYTNDNFISLDQELQSKYDDGGSINLKDKISINSDNIYGNQLPNYDAIDKNGNEVGWKRDTFAEITSAGKTTLRNWDRKDLLKPKRYEIYSKLWKKKIYYRAYTEEDRKKVKDVKEMMRKKQRHEK